MLALAIVMIPSAVSWRPSPTTSASACTGGGGPLGIERDLAAEKTIGVDAAEHGVRIGDRRLLPAVAVARRPGACTGASWANPESAGSIDMRDRAAPSADRVNVQHRDEQRVAGHPRVARRGLHRHPRSVTMPMSAEVPPMSNVISRARPESSPAQTPPRMPAAGPESSSVTGFSAAADAVATPPLDIITCSSPGTPSSRSEAASCSR